MKNLKVPYLLLFALILSSVCYSQQRAVTSIQQNINEAAHGLEQKLNFTLDTLTLRSTSDILRVTFLDHSAKDSHIIDVGNKEVKIPLYHFKKGRYTIAVYTHDKIIALGANRINDIPVPKDAVADLEESILRSSLTEDELVSRNIKPLKRKDTRVAIAKPKRDINKKAKRKVKAKKTNVAQVKDKRVSKEKEASVTMGTSKPNKVKDTRVAEVKSKSKRIANKRPKSNGKSIFALALEKKKLEKSKADAGKKEFTKIKSEKDVVTSDDVQDESAGTLITVKKVTYNLSKIDNDTSVNRQSRAEYRANNLRPNGTAYED